MSINPCIGAIIPEGRLLIKFLAILAGLNLVKVAKLEIILQEKSIIDL